MTPKPFRLGVKRGMETEQMGEGARGRGLKEELPGEDPGMSRHAEGCGHGESGLLQAGGLVGSEHAEEEGREGARPCLGGDFLLHTPCMLKGHRGKGSYRAWHWGRSPWEKGREWGSGH